jgi:hypothetical protein
MWSIQETARFCNPSRDFGTGTLMRGNTYEFFLAYTRLSLSLSLSPPLEERAKEERLGGVGPWSGPTTQGLPYPANAYLTTSAYPTSLTCALWPVAIRHTLDWYGAMPPFVACAATRLVSIRYVSNQYGAMPPFVVHAVSNHLDRHFRSPLSGTACRSTSIDRLSPLICRLAIFTQWPPIAQPPIHVPPTAAPSCATHPLLPLISPANLIPYTYIHCLLHIPLSHAHCVISQECMHAHPIQTSR